MGETLWAAYLQTLLDKLDPGHLMNFACREGFESELRKWKKIMRKIMLVLGDADEKQLSSKEVKKWLDDLLDLAYDADDVLDEIDCEALKRQNNSSSDPETSICQVQDMLAQIKEITTRFQGIEEEKTDLELKAKDGIRSSIINNRTPTTSLLDSSGVVGREQDVVAILELMGLSETTKAEAHEIPGFGMGGFGSDVNNISNGLHCPTSLTEIRIAKCKNLRTLPDGIISSSNSNLKVLEIGSCESLESFPCGVLPSTLKRLSIGNCRKLESISEMLLGPASLDRIEFFDYQYENVELFDKNFPGHFVAEEGLDQSRARFYTLTVLSTNIFRRSAFRISSAMDFLCANLKYDPCLYPNFSMEEKATVMFYTLIVLSTDLFGKPAFWNLICHGLFLTDDGK
ncbi:Rx, N-terminal [Dillenia turbinata]|uniref:Rx, N-terminal n=1 Tax=Dillenia turbinata TaxID=194707 RepID=A0AAN8VTI9_9MAGN